LFIERYQNKISHLTPEQLEEMMELYYAGEKIELLLDHYKIDTVASCFYKTFPVVVYDESPCPYCGSPMFSYRPSKKSMTPGSISQKEPLFCLPCGHQPSNNYCKCKGCRPDKKKKKKKPENDFNIKEFIKNPRGFENKKPAEEPPEKEKQEIEIEKKTRERLKVLAISDYIFAVELKELDLLDRLYLASLLRVSLSEDFSVIQPVINSPEKLAPTPTYQKEIIERLYYNHFIKIDVETPTDLVTLEDGFVERYYPLHVLWQLNESPAKKEKPPRPMEFA